MTPPMTPPPRRRLLASCLAAACLSSAVWPLATGAAPEAPCAVSWPAWEAFKRQFLSPDGRVVDPSSDRRHTVSEGQAYALFFALVANDRTAFELILQWTENNLAAGDLSAHLPAWRWGLQDPAAATPHWGVLDPNPASDADLWLAYTLIEAGQRWRERRHTAYGRLLAARILSEEVSDLPGLGATLLPGPQGFHPAPTHWRLNPSYVPLPLLRRLTRFDARWHGVLASAQRLIVEPARHGFSPDWVGYQSGQGFVADRESEASGSYNAIRVYLWAGLMAAEDPARKALLAALSGMPRAIGQLGAPPESVATDRPFELAGVKPGPAGFRAALIPFLIARGESALAEQQRQRLRDSPVAADAYYGQALQLFAAGWLERRYAFAADGTLQLPSPASCARTDSLPPLLPPR